MPGYESAKMLTPWEYFANGVGTVVESVGAFIGLLLLAVSLIILGGVLIYGYEHIKTRFSKSDTAGDDDATSDPKSTRRLMRPYRKAKETGVPRDDRLYGLILVFAGLGLLYIIPAYLFGDRSSSTSGSTHAPPADAYTGQPLPHSRKFSLSDSKPGQAILGGLTLVILIVSISLLGTSSSRPANKEKGKGRGKQ